MPVTIHGVDFDKQGCISPRDLELGFNQTYHSMVNPKVRANPSLANQLPGLMFQAGDLKCEDGIAHHCGVTPGIMISFGVVLRLCLARRDWWRRHFSSTPLHPRCQLVLT